VLGSIQAHLSYTVRRGLWVAFDCTWYGGGAVHLNHGPGMSRQSSSRVGGTVSFPVGKVQSIKVAYSSGVTARAGSSFNTLSVGWQYVRLVGTEIGGRDVLLFLRVPARFSSQKEKRCAADRLLRTKEGTGETKRVFALHMMSGVNPIQNWQKC